MSEVKEYISVNEKEFGKNKTLELTINGNILDSNLQKIVQDKVNDLNTKLDNKYDTSVMDNGDENIGDAEKARLTAQLKDIIKGFNTLIAQIEEDYIGQTKEKQTEIKTDISTYFSDKSLFVEQGKGVASALRGYAGMDASDAAPARAKELPLN
ncbi:MAG: hypothetical protein PHQ95_02735 [Candidatus Gracilibacteria bacterium]|nr:hypothetical protein [Candidatus Gracilibacteria bacterium]